MIFLLRKGIIYFIRNRSGQNECQHTHTQGGYNFTQPKKTFFHNVFIMILLVKHFVGCFIVAKYHRQSQQLLGSAKVLTI